MPARHRRRPTKTPQGYSSLRVQNTDCDGQPARRGRRRSGGTVWNRLLGAAFLFLYLTASCGHDKPVAPPGDVTPPDPVRDLSVAARGDTVVLLAWTAPGDDSTEGRAAGYDVRYDDVPITDQTFRSSYIVQNVPLPDSAGTRDSVLVAGLSYDTAYYFALKTIDEVPNTSALSNVVTFRTPVRPVKPDTTPPSPVTDLRATEVTTSTVTVAWTATGDDGDRGRASAYDLRYATEYLTPANWDAARRTLGVPTPASAGLEETFSVAGLSAGTDYYFALRIRDDAGNVSELSNTTAARTRSYTGSRHVRADGTGEYSSIQDAIADAQDGDEILVGPGTYDENIDFLGKRIAVRSEMGPEVTTIDGGGRERSVVVFQSGERRDSILEGFTITGGRGTYYGTASVWGGGISIRLSAPSILRNKIVGNSAVRSGPSLPMGYGGGIYCSPGTLIPSALVAQNVIKGNTAGANGGGIAINGNGQVVMTENQVLENNTLSGDGGGIWVLSDRSGLQVQGNCIVGNVAADHGGGFYEGSAVPGSYFESIITHNLFHHNRADGIEGTGTSGGGLWLKNSRCQIIQNTFVANAGGGVGARGGNIALEDSGAPHFERNIVVFATGGGGVACTGGTPTFEKNIVWQNSGGNGTGLCANWYMTGGNMVVDPLLCHPDVPDATVAENSPALTSPVGVIGASTPGCPAVQAAPAAGAGVWAHFWTR